MPSSRSDSQFAAGTNLSNALTLGAAARGKVGFADLFKGVPLKPPDGFLLSIHRPKDPGTMTELS